VLKGERKEYSREYSCHAPRVQRWFLGRVARFNTGNLCRIVIEHIDITERRKSEQTLQFQYSLIRAIHDVSLDGILVVNGDDKVVSYNKRFLDVWQISEPNPVDNPTHGYMNIPNHEFLSAGADRVKDREAFLRRVQELDDNPREMTVAKFN